MDNNIGVALKRVTVNFAIETYNLLQDLAKRQKVSMSEALRRAIKLHAFLLKRIDEGDKVLIKKKNNDVTELLLEL
jgi:hypothetical protein